MLSNSVLLVIGGALVTGILAALVFGSNGTAEDKRLRDEQKLLRALDAQRRIRDARLMREARRRGAPPVKAPPAPVVQAEPEPAGVEDTEPERRATERQRKREGAEQAAALKAERDAEKRARRRAEQERRAAAKAERAELRASERQQKHEAKTARKVAQAEARAARAQAEARMKLQPLPAPEPEPEEPKHDGDATPLAELPLFSWAHRIEDDDAPTRGAS